jgi:hypothetical protein
MIGPGVLGGRGRRGFPGHRVFRIRHEGDEIRFGPAPVVRLALLVEVLEVLKGGVAGDFESWGEKRLDINFNSSII